MTAILPVVHGAHVEDAALGALRRWMPKYLDAIGAGRDLDDGTYRVGSYARSTAVDQTFPEESLPCVTVRAGRKTNDGERAGGAVDAWFELSVGILVADQQRAETATVAWDFATAVEAILIQQPSLDGFAATTEWQATTPTEVQVRSRTLAGVVVEALVLVDAVINALDGPVDPEDPLDPDAIVQTVDVDAEPADKQPA